MFRWFTRGFNMKRRHLRIIFVLFIVIAGVLVYSNSLDNGFLLDDRYSVKENAFIGDLSNLKFLFDRDRFFRGTKEGTYRPITTITYFLDNAIWDYEAFGYHLTNVLFHVVNGVMLYFVLCALLGARPEDDLSPGEARAWSARILVPFAAAVFFTVHPVQTETVNNIGTRHEAVMTLFYLGAIWTYLRSVSPEAGRRGLFYALSLLFYGLSCFSKEMGFTLPAVLVLCDLYAGGSIERDRMFKYAGYAVVAALFLFVRFGVMAYPGEAGAGFFDPARLLLTGRMIATYLWLFIFPLRLSVEYPFGQMFPGSMPSSAADPAFFVPVIVTAAVLAGAIAIRKKAPLAFFGAGWFFITILPVSNIFFRLMQFPIRERYIYLPCAGFCIFLAAVLWKVFQSPRIKAFRYNRMALAAVFILLTVLYSARTYARNNDWQNAVTLWKATKGTSPGSYRVYYNLGMAYQYEKGNTERALEYFQKSLSLRDMAITHDAVGYIYYQQGDYEKALSELQKARQMDPSLGSVYYHLGLLYVAMGEYDKAIALQEEGFSRDENREGALFRYVYNPMPRADMHFVIGLARFNKAQYDEAVRQFRETLRFDPIYPNAHYHLAYSLIKSGRYAEAEKVLEKGIDLYPDDPGLRYLLATSLMKRRLYEKSLEQYEKVLELDPGDVNARNNLANIYYTKGRIDEAMEQYRRILESKPSHYKARNNLANIYLSRKIYDKAIGEYKAIIRQRPASPVVRYNLGLAYYGKKMYDKAREEWQEALRLKPDFEPARNALLKLKIKGY
ncbi:MAG: tetratricopeptide repeat protein [Candidatus Omnitrophica bacterium]|nr:tetratricopeptide repeat protein [Candidatus Omnitrophota bacterium]